MTIPAVLLLASASIPSTPTLGMAEGRCRPSEPGPAVVITAHGLKDRRGRLRAELYPPDDDDFLADDNVLVGAGKLFRRVVEPVPPAGAVTLCIRVPGPGRYALSLLHDRDGNGRFGISTDGIGFPNDPSLGLSKPAAAAATFRADAGITHLTIRLNYRRGLFRFGPVGDK